MNLHLNITRIKAVYNALGPLKDKAVFVGGAPFYCMQNTKMVSPKIWFVLLMM